MELIMFTLLAIFMGMRHGMDSDHVAAIADMVGSEGQKRKQVSLGVMYAFGHGLIVLIIGILSIYIGLKLPQATQQMMEILVSLTLIILGGVIIFSIFRKKNDYEYKSRLQIVSEFIVNIISKTKFGQKVRNLSPVSLGVIGAFLIGIIHGIGVESPTQVVLLTNAVGLDNITAALQQLILFVIGLLISTIALTFCLSWGFMKARFKRKLFLVLGSITGAYSLWLGIFMLVELIKGGI